MFRYQTSYRFYTLAKIGFALAYLWYIWDFFRIHVAIWDQLSPLLSDPSDIIFSGNPYWDVFLRRIAIFLNGKAIVWIFVLTSPLAVGLYLWGRNKWLQFAVGCWMSFSMISLTALVGIFTSTVDIWVNLAFVIYSLIALTSPADEWEKCESGLSLARWRDDPSLASAYAWLMVLLQFAVYFFAGVNKLIYGWKPWTTGVALQNLAFDSSMHEFVRGTSVPYWLSLILCYITLLQRLVVPFGFFFRRYRFWSVLILGTMHIGYAILMYVNLFPLIGMASLLLILPPRTWPRPRASAKAAPPGGKMVSSHRQTTLVKDIVIGLFSLWLVMESSRLTLFSAMPWENKLMVVPAWRMFADGGVFAGGKWRLILVTPHGKVDATDIALQALPHLWRDRFYIDTIFHDLLNKHTAPGSLVDRLIQSTEKTYRDRQLQLNESPVVLNVSFDLYRWEPALRPH
jgi:Vitamin K-dependent gamma-carboxylase